MIRGMCLSATTVLVLLTGCGAPDNPLSPSIPGNVDDIRMQFVQYSAPAAPGGFTAAVTFTVTGENLARSTVTTPASEQFVLWEQPTTAGSSLLESTVRGGLQALNGRFPNGTYSLVTMFDNGFALFSTYTFGEAFPLFPDVISPVAGEKVTLTPVIEWWRAFGTDRHEVVIVDPTADKIVFSMEVGGTADRVSVTIPPGVLQAATTYRIEVHAVSLGGQRTSASVVHVKTA